MDMKTFIETEGREAAIQLAERVGTKYVYLSQISSGFRQPSRILAKALERESGGKLTCKELRSDQNI